MTADAALADVAAHVKGYVRNADRVNRCVRLVARERPVTFLAVVRQLDAYNRAACRLRQALESELKRAAAWEDFLDEHKELTA